MNRSAVTENTPWLIYHRRAAGRSSHRCSIFKSRMLAYLILLMPLLICLSGGIVAAAVLTADYTADPTQGKAPLKVTFEDNSSAS